MRGSYITRMDEELSRTVKAGLIHENPQTHEVVADETALTALAERFGIPGIAKLRGDFTLRHKRSGVIAATLRMHARVTQVCVVTLEPFESDITEEAELRFVPIREQAEDEEEEFLPESLEGPDELPYANGIIDLGAALAEQLALALDPYPRKPGAELPPEASDDSAHPFAALKSRLGKPD
ncbi:YceD family protein [Acidocella aromatica]|uniref:Uncharacterized metal-binding protein YceD (DUF177 family) n=1 Tax=Acidocella aromatica TaxID=1303579 RepID=A0A840V8Y7_9PROT|nr:YceD family protein [Acidocella aromatica]MBB5372428.1 uncharacterized metal-binding protein YceD (DUF177 family) [Acidocella aromatica]